MMKLITINTWMGKLSPTLVKFIANEQPDIICAQEVFNSPIDVPLPDSQFNVGPAIKKAAGLEHEFFSELYSIDVAGLEVPFGNVIYSRYPIVNQKVHLVGQPVRHLDESNYVGLGKEQVRSAQIATMDVGGGLELVVAHHHGYIARGTGERFGDEHSEESMRKVAEILREFDTRPLILAGDLNVIGESKTMRVFDGFLHDLTVENRIATTLSPTHWFGEPVACDHILVNDQIKIDNFAARDVIVSDHLPLVIEFELK